MISAVRSASHRSHRRLFIRILGLDVGDRWIGVALSDPGGILATPLVNIDRRAEFDAIASIADIVDRHDVGKIVVGLPRSMDGKVRQQAQKVEEFVGLLSARIAVHVEYRDERLSTVSAARFMREARAGKPKNKIRDDSAAAAIILQGYLDQMRLESGEED